MEKNTKIFSPKDFSFIVNEPLSAKVKNKIKNLNIKYARLTPEERDECIKAAIKILLESEADASGEHRLNRWEKGWSENFDALKEKGKNGLVPKYFYRDYNLAGINKCGKLKQEYIKPLETGFDYKILSIILEWLFEKYAVGADSIYEFGCGTGHHLLRIREFNKTAKIYGLDWTKASQEIIKEIIAKGIAKNIYGRKFDFFNPDKSLVLDKNSVVYTVGALEQVGDKHKKFIDYLLKNKNKPKVCFHIEPIGELLDEFNLLDYLAKEYYKKRNYLSNFISHLKFLEKNKKINIQKAQRTYLGGSLLTEYAVVVWTPVVYL